MKILRNIIVLFIISLGYSVYGQVQPDCNYMIAKIDSIAKARNIENAVVITGGYTEDNSLIARRQKFSFDAPFLVIDDYYIDMNKLIFFRVIEKKIKGVYFEFVFQGY